MSGLSKKAGLAAEIVTSNSTPEGFSASSSRWRRIGSRMVRRSGPTSSASTRGRSAREALTMRCSPPTTAPAKPSITLVFG